MSDNGYPCPKCGAWIEWGREHVCGAGMTFLAAGRRAVDVLRQAEKPLADAETAEKRIKKLEGNTNGYESAARFRDILAEVKGRIDKAWHAVCGSGLPGPDALAHLLEVLDGQHNGADPHMAAIAVLREVGKAEIAEMKARVEEAESAVSAEESLREEIQTENIDLHARIKELEAEGDAARPKGRVIHGYCRSCGATGDCDCAHRG